MVTFIVHGVLHMIPKPFLESPYLNSVTPPFPSDNFGYRGYEFQYTIGDKKCEGNIYTFESGIATVYPTTSW